MYTSIVGTSFIKVEGGTLTKVLVDYSVGSFNKGKDTN